MIILDGKNYSKKLKNEIKDEVAKLIKQTSVKPGLAIVLVGENPASCIYVRNKMKAAAFVICCQFDKGRRKYYSRRISKISK